MEDPADAGMEPEVEAPSSFLPPFANAENKALDAHVQQLERQLELVDHALAENGDRMGVMDDHLKNVQQEITYTETRVETEKKEITTENHLKIMAEKELSRVTKDIERLQRERLELGDRVSGLQAQIYRGSEKLDQFKLLMNWNQEELEQWALAQKQKEEDNEALERYQKQDQSKQKELAMAVEKMTKEVAVRRTELEAEVTETQAAQIQLDRAAEDFRALHEERQALIQQWDEAVVAMRRRDEAIAVSSEAFAEKKALLRTRQSELDSQARFLEAEKANNKELEGRISAFEREVARHRDAFGAEQARLSDLANAVDVAKAQLAKAANDLATATVENEAARAELEKRRVRLETSRRRHAALKRKLEGEFGALDSLEARVGELEGLRKSEEARLKALQKEHEELKKEAFRRGQALFELRRKEREYIAEIAGGQSQNKNLAARIMQLDEQVLRQQELLYNVDFALQDMERRVARAKGVRTEDETRALNARIERLTTVLEGVNTQHAMLIEQVKAAEISLIEAKRHNNKLGGDKSSLDGRLTTLKLETDSVSRTLKQAVSEKERTLVEHDVLKLEVKRLRDVLAMGADEVCSLEARRAALRAGLEERKAEIEVHRDGLKAELKLVREDVHRITLELRERQLRAERLAAKFDSMSSKGRATEEGGEPKSQAYYIIKAAQEREELQQQGDKLDSAIQKAETEVAGLEATLGQLVNTNCGFSASLRAADNKAAGEEQAALRQRLDHTYDRLKALRNAEASLMEQVQAAQARSSSTMDEQRGLKAVVDDLARKKAEAERQLEDQQEKHERARKASDRLLRQIRTKDGTANSSSGSDGSNQTSTSARAASAGGAAASSADEGAGAVNGGGALGAADVAEREARLAELREASRAMLGEVRALALQNPGVAEAFEEAGLKLPTGSVTNSATSSRAGSLAGSRAASRAGSIKSQTSFAPEGRSKLGGAGAVSGKRGSLVAAGSVNGGSRPGSSASGRIAAVKTVQLGL